MTCVQGTKINSPHYLAKLRAPAGESVYTLVVSQYEKSTTIRYTLRVYSEAPVQLSAVGDLYGEETHHEGQVCVASECDPRTC